LDEHSGLEESGYSDAIGDGLVIDNVEVAVHARRMRMVALTRLFSLVRKVILISLLGVSVSGTLRAETRSENAPPNLVFLLTDDQRYDSLGCMGNPVISTPHLDGMAEDGVIFDRAFVTTAICMTSRASVFTGQYAARHGIWNFNIDFTAEQLENTYLGQLKAAGYRTGFIGKWGVGNPKSADPVLDYNRGFPGQSRYFEGDVEKKQGRHLTAKMGDQAVEFLKGCEPDQPFHLSISFKAPHCQDSNQIHADHFPYDPAFSDLYADITIPPFPASSYEQYDRMPDFIKNSMNRDRWAIRFRSPGRFQKSVKDYYRLIFGIDAVVGRIREQLAAQGLAENTVIVFTSDHGFFLGEYGFAGKWTPHELSIRVPMIVHDPRLPREQRGRRLEAMALNIDVAPTLLDYAGLAPPTGMQGRSLASLVEGEQPEDWRTDFFYEHWFTAGGQIVPSEGYRDERWKYARYLVPGEEKQGTARWEELYDLETDPHEMENLASLPEHAETLEKVRQAWSEWRERAK